MAKEGQAYVMKKMKETVLTNPQMNEVAQKQLSEKFQKEYQAKAIAKIIQKVKNKQNLQECIPYIILGGFFSIKNFSVYSSAVTHVRFV